MSLASLVEQFPTTLVVRLPTETDPATAQPVQQELLGLPGDRRRATLVLDLSATEFIDSAGLPMIAATRRLVRSADVQVRVAAPTYAVARAFGLIEFHRFVPVFSSVDEAR